jgi:hypothetical protein
LAEFHEDYFNFPLYRDESLGFYQALGNKSLLRNVGMNPLKWYSNLKKMNNRTEKKQISGNMVGSGVTKGGIVIFGADGSPKFVYPEETGSEIEVEDLLAAVRSVRGGHSEL